MQLMLQARTANNQRPSFLQIGANDGEMFDPLYPHFQTTEKKAHWLGLQAEPQPNLYGALNVLHADAPDWAFYPGAVASPEYCINGTINFCETKTPGVGEWDTQGQVNQITDNCDVFSATMHHKRRPCVSSLDDLIFRHATPVYLDYVMNATTGGGAHNTQRSYNVDHLQIDVEGKDYDILKLIDWNQLYPLCIHFERAHLGANEKHAQDLLTKMGYSLVENAMDTLACLVARPSPPSPLPS